MKTKTIILFSFSIFFVIGIVSASVLYYSPNCPHCQNVLPYLYKDSCIEKCDVNNAECYNQFTKLGLNGYPTLVFENGTTIVGDTPILNYLNNNPYYSKIPNVNDKLIGEKKIGNLIYEVWYDYSENQAFLGMPFKSSL